MHHESEGHPVWDLHVPKTNNRELAERLVANGYAARIEDIYVELTPEQQQRLEEKRKYWESQREFINNNYPWADDDDEPFDEPFSESTDTSIR